MNVKNVRKSPSIFMNPSSLMCKIRGILFIYSIIMEFTHSFRKLIVWQQSKKLTLFIYKISKAFPKTEIYGITSQLRRASSSIMANIAEGNNRQTNKDKLKFWNIAFSSLCEVDSFLELCKELKYSKDDEHKKALELMNKTAFLLRRLIQSKTS